MSEKKQPENMLEDILARPSDAEMIAQGLLPESCAWHLETALAYAQKCKNTEFIEEAWMHIDVVIEQLQEIKSKIKKAREA